VQLSFDPAGWHAYTIEWGARMTAFRVDGDLVLQTPVSPAGPLGLVMWVDNQYAALPPEGRFRYGTLPNPEVVWVEVEELVIHELRE
jgi:hypothetical protein